MYNKFWISTYLNNIQIWIREDFKIKLKMWINWMHLIEIQHIEKHKQNHAKNLCAKKLGGDERSCMLLWSGSDSGGWKNARATACSILCVLKNAARKCFDMHCGKQKRARLVGGLYMKPRANHHLAAPFNPHVYLSGPPKASYRNKGLYNCTSMYYILHKWLKSNLALNKFHDYIFYGTIDIDMNLNVRLFV